jgi:hypothetical protein
MGSGVPPPLALELSQQDWRVSVTADGDVSLRIRAPGGTARPIAISVLLLILPGGIWIWWRYLQQAVMAEIDATGHPTVSQTFLVLFFGAALLRATVELVGHLAGDVEWRIRSDRLEVRERLVGLTRRRVFTGGTVVIRHLMGRVEYLLLRDERGRQHVLAPYREIGLWARAETIRALARYVCAVTGWPGEIEYILRGREPLG